MDLWFKVIFDSQPWRTDITLLNLPWRPVEESGKGLGYEGWSGKGGKLRVGVMRHDGVVRPVKPIRRAIDATVEALEASGTAEFVEVEPMGFEEGWELTVSVISTRHDQSIDDSLPCTISMAVKSSVVSWRKRRCYL